jgi:asparagine synthase (glutamine-hydrolysing)
MCGICGLMRGDPGERVDEETLEAMNRALAHRGPDDAGTWFGGPVGLAMRRLSVIDLFNGHQPMANHDGSLVVVFNGEIYNFKDIRADLERRGHVFRTQSDTEVILRGYEQFGDDIMQQLNGMFAFAVYDGKRERLLLARDRIGIKPLFYALHRGGLAFSSELDSLLRSGFVNGRLNPEALDAYFTYLYIPAPDTVFEGVQQLRPGEKLVFHKGEATTERYWSVQFQTTRSWTLDSAAEAYMQLLEDAVRLQRVSDVPLGAFLSGGVDSTSVVGMLSLMSPGALRTFTIGFDDAHGDELEYARIAAKHFGTDHTEEIMRPELVEMASDLVRHFGQPFADSSAIPTWLVSKLARSQVTVALSGDGGDELFAGYTWAHMTRRVGKYSRLPILLRLAVDTALRVLPRTPRVEKLRRFSNDSFLPPLERFRRRLTCLGAPERHALYAPEFAKRVGTRAVDRFQDHADAAGSISDDDLMLHQDLHMYLPDDILTKVDRMSMAHGLEARVPILDHRIVEFAATVPFALKLKGRTSKRVVKRGLASLVPPELLKQRKRGFAIPIQRWFREDLHGHFQEAALARDARNGQYLNSQAIRALFQTHIDGKADNGHALWAILMFEHWLRYVDAVREVSQS